MATILILSFLHWTVQRRLFCLVYFTVVIFFVRKSCSNPRGDLEVEDAKRDKVLFGKLGHC